MRIPLTAFMRNNGTDASPNCILLVNSFNISANGQNFVFGEAFFQNFYIGFEFLNDQGTENYFTIIESELSLPGTATTDTIYPS